MNETIYAGKMPVLALRGLTVFPDQTVHFDVGRMKSVLALEAAMKDNQILFLVICHNQNVILHKFSSSFPEHYYKGKSVKIVLKSL